MQYLIPGWTFIPSGPPSTGDSARLSSSGLISSARASCEKTSFVALGFGSAAVNGWLAIPNSFSAETMAHQGWDSLTFDMQHGVVDYQAMVPMLQASSTTDTVPVVRVPWLEPASS
jgi:hypothetical protein